MLKHRRSGQVTQFDALIIEFGEVDRASILMVARPNNFLDFRNDALQALPLCVANHPISQTPTSSPNHQVPSWFAEMLCRFAINSHTNG